MATQDKPKNAVKAVRTTFHILEALERHDGLRLTELANELGIAKSTAHRYLQTLASMGYLVREKNTYALSHRFMHFGTHVRTRDPRYELIDEKVEMIAERTGELAQFITEEHGQAVYVLQAIGENGVQIDTVTGKHDPIHTTAAGKAILSTWPREEVENHLDEHGLPGLTPYSITGREALFDELDKIQKRGYSINNQENIEGLKAISMPIMASDNRAIGSLSVSGPTNRMSGEWFDTELPNLLLGICNELELNFRFLK
jgi:DNA-binding IclR family transcriptional regulator